MSDELSPEQLEQIYQAICEGGKIHAIKLYRQITRKGLKESKDFIEGIQEEKQQTSDELSPELVEQINQAICDGNKIQAIKIYNQATGKGLYNSKEFIEALISQLVESEPEKYALIAKSSSGCAGMILLAVATSFEVVAGRFILGVLVVSLTINNVFAQESSGVKGSANNTKKTEKVEAPKDVVKKYDSIEKYKKIELSGWPLIVHRDLIEQEPELWNEVKNELVHQFHQVVRRVPAPAVEKLKLVSIWVELGEKANGSLVYHPNRNWLLNHNMHPDKAKCVEIANARRFMTSSIPQPYVILHELAHAWHDQQLTGGHGNSEIALTHARAKQRGLYGMVMHINVPTRQSYAAKNPMEYFAESSEAFFGTNDFYPFVRAELKQYDLEMYELLVRLWGVEKTKG